MICVCCLTCSAFQVIVVVSNTGGAAGRSEFNAPSEDFVLSVCWWSDEQLELFAVELIAEELKNILAM